MRRKVISTICVLTICLVAFTMMPLTANAASKSGSQSQWVSNCKYTVACNANTFKYQNNYAWVTSTMSFNWSEPRCKGSYAEPCYYYKDVLATANNSGFIEASTSNACYSTCQVVYQKLSYNKISGTVKGFTTGTITKSYSVNTAVSSANAKFPDVISVKRKVKNGYVYDNYGVKSGTLTVKWKKYAKNKTAYNNSRYIMLSGKYGYSTVKPNPTVSVKGLNITFSKGVKSGNLAKTDAYVK